MVAVLQDAAQSHAAFAEWLVYQATLRSQVCYCFLDGTALIPGFKIHLPAADFEP